MEIAALMQGRDKSGGYCLEMNMGRVSRPVSRRLRLSFRVGSRPHNNLTGIKE